ncbi:aminomethyl-transferring glycine dehydrogenase subunit GcvPA [Anaerospora hongkongensis]|uniref:aminomethyl-transferring glycine dehydrogenase subunit GcvPA n=1 Tax=Anaerospora hongkongensis TaxID=244830 RepID=UPI00289DB209|nr:aminomethyl-transferring glycine dehydrogenase subunit GcvPA [Anaerospora hongkongensis]
MAGQHYLPNTPADRQTMLQAIGVQSVEELFADIPADIRLTRPLSLPPALSELQIMRIMQQKAASNRNVEEYPCFLGAGAYDHFIPAVVSHLAGRAEFYTAYTQYQPEISQGGLQALWEYQSFICELTGLDVSNASLYDGATAAAEAMNLACGVTGRKKVLISEAVHPFYRQVAATYARDFGFLIQTLPVAEGKTVLPETAGLVDKEIAAIIVQSPNFYGIIEDMANFSEAVHRHGGLFVAVVNPTSLALVQPPGQYGADIAVGEGQPLGLGLNFGGPYLGFMAVREKYMRRMPGRIVGQTVDSQGRRGFVLTLQAREQHIRREKAYSNICSNEGLCAVMAGIYIAAMGHDGLRHVANMCLQKAHYAAKQIAALPGYSLLYNGPFFHEFVIKTPCPAADINAALLAKGIIGGLDLGTVDSDRTDQLLLCVTEKRTREEIDQLVAALEGLA